MRSRALPLLAPLLALVAAAPAAAQVTLEGFVTDPTGAPVPDADLDFFEAQNGTKINLGAELDKTDFQGWYSITVSPDIYHVRIEPPVERTELAPIQERDLILATSQTLDVTLPLGARLTGRVTGPDGAPVAAVDLDLIDRFSGVRAATVRDDTDGSGIYAFSVIPGRYDVALSPPIGSGAGPRRILSADVTTDAVLDVVLPRGFRVSGVVQTETGSGVFFADLDARDRASRQSIPLTDDETDFSGAFLLNLPEGRLDLFANPPRGAPFASAALYDLNIDADVDLGTIVLGPGVLLTGSVLDPAGSPLANADLDLFLTGGCDPYPIPSGMTDGSGTYSFRAAPGTYDLVVEPPASSSLAPHRFEDVVLSADATLDFQYPSASPQTLPVDAIVLDDTGNRVEGVRVLGEPLVGGAMWEALTGADGSFSAAVVSGTYRIELEPPDGSDLAPFVLESVDLPCQLPPSVRFTERVLIAAPSTGVVTSRPNPWGASTNITLALAAPLSDAVVEVFDLAGRHVRTLHRGAMANGTAQIPWDGTNDSGRQVSSGMYVVRLSGSGQTASTKIARIRP